MSPPGEQTFHFLAAVAVGEPVLPLALVVGFVGARVGAVAVGLFGDDVALVPRVVVVVNDVALALLGDLFFEGRGVGNGVFLFVECADALVVAHVYKR